MRAEVVIALAPELDSFGPASPAALIRIHGDPERPLAATSDHALLDQLPGDAVGASSPRPAPPRARR